VQYPERKDVVRAACRLLNNVCELAGVVVALDGLSLLDRLLETASKHAETKDVIECVASIMKALYKRTNPRLNVERVACIEGLLNVFKAKVLDDDLVIACAELLSKYLKSQSDLLAQSKGLLPSSSFTDALHPIPAPAPGSESAADSSILAKVSSAGAGISSIMINSVREDLKGYSSPDGRDFYHEVCWLTIRALEHFLGYESASTRNSKEFKESSLVGEMSNLVLEKSDRKVETNSYNQQSSNPLMISTTSPIRTLPVKKKSWSKSSVRHLSSLMSLLESIREYLIQIPKESPLFIDLAQALSLSIDMIPLKSSDIGKRIHKLLDLIQPVQEKLYETVDGKGDPIYADNIYLSPSRSRSHESDNSANSSLASSKYHQFSIYCLKYSFYSYINIIYMYIILVNIKDFTKLLASRSD
jgi:hypothetical protein